MKRWCPSTQEQWQELSAYAIAIEQLQQARNEVSRRLRRDWLDECIADLNTVGISQSQADAFLTHARIFNSEYVFCFLDEPGAPSEAFCRAYNALQVASERIGKNNYKAGLYGNPQLKKHKPYSITEAHQKVVDAMYDLQAGRITPEEAMALLMYDYDIQKQRLLNVKQ